MDEIVKIDFFGEEFRFKSDQYIENADAVVHCLEQHIEQASELFKQNASGSNKIAVLLLAAINLSKELEELKTTHHRFEKEVMNKISSLANKIDKGIE